MIALLNEEKQVEQGKRAADKAAKDDAKKQKKAKKAAEYLKKKNAVFPTLVDQMKKGQQVLLTLTCPNLKDIHNFFFLTPTPSLSKMKKDDMIQNIQQRWLEVEEILNGLVNNHEGEMGII